MIYLKETGSEFVYQNSFNLPNTRHEFEVIRLWEIPAREMLAFPGLLPFVALGKTTNRAEILREVAKRIEEIGENRQKRNNVAAATSILAGLVLRKDIIRQLFREEIMQESVIYQDILEKGRQKEAVSLISRQLNRRFGQLSTPLAEQIRGLDVERLEQLGEDLLDFSGEEDLIAWLSRN